MKSCLNLFYIFVCLVAFSFASKAGFAALHLGVDGVISQLPALFWGVRLDAAICALLATIIYLSIFIESLAWKRQWVSRMLFGLALAWLILTAAADSVYMFETGRHLTFEVFLGQGLEFGLVSTAILKFPSNSLWAFILLCGAACLLLFWPFTQRFRMGKLRGAGFAVVWFVFAVICVRGGLSDAPQSPMSAYKIGDPDQARVAWSAPYAVAYYLSRGEKRAALRVTPEASAEDLALLSQQPSKDVAANLDFQTANVVMVLLESWSAADIYSYSQRVNAAPRFDELRKRSLTTRAMYADGYRTVEGMFSVFCSYPNPVGGGVAGTQLQGMEYHCLPRLLRERGWDTHFIQGSGKGAVGAFAQSLGFEHSYGKKDFEFEAEQNYWGYMDDDIYRFSLDKIKSLQSPYYVTVNTGSTHDLYLPDQDAYVFGEGDYDAKRQSVLHHADAALDRFVQKLLAETDGRTLIVLVGDHTAGMSRKGLDRNAVAFLMLSSDGSLPVVERDIISSQRDIAPTVIDWLGGYVPWFAGNSLLDSDYQGVASFSDGQSIGWVENDRFLRFNAESDQLEGCFSLEASAVVAMPMSCDDSQILRLKAQARAFTRYTQALLFSGETVSFGSQ